MKVFGNLFQKNLRVMSILLLAFFGLIFLAAAYRGLLSGSHRKRISFINNVIQISQGECLPEKTDVMAGAKITLTNLDLHSRQLKEKGGKFQTQFLRQYASVGLVFESRGTFQVYCSEAGRPAYIIVQ